MVGVIGHPIGHTLSPKMHNAAFAASGLDYVYVPMDVRPENLPAAVSGLRALGFRGFNVTMPHKEAILPLLDDLDEAARVSGAVNTVVVEERGLLGMNTDGSGFVEACEGSGLSFVGARVLLVGAGGAPRSCGTGCGQHTRRLGSRCTTRPTPRVRLTERTRSSTPPTLG